MAAVLAGALALGLLAAGWSAGFFWTWSFAVMPGLAAAGPDAAVAAMRATNAGIRTPGFAFVFFGPAPLALLAAAAAFLLGLRPAALAAAAAFLVYAGGVLFVTFAENLPLNDRLAAADLAREGAAAAWARYAGEWTAWNHLRTAAATLAFAALAGSAALALRR